MAKSSTTIKSQPKIKTRKVLSKTKKPVKKIKNAVKKSNLIPSTKVGKTDDKNIKKTLARTLSLNITDTKGKTVGKMSIPAGIFNAKFNLPLISQAVRIYSTNFRTGQASTKTRGQVSGSTRKIYRQKGTGKARHGAIRAPIFVGGGITFGPKPRDYSLNFNQKMKIKALFSALSYQFKNGNISAIDGLDKLNLKTKIFAGVFNNIIPEGRILLITTKKIPAYVRAVRNIDNISIIPSTDLNAYICVSYQKIVFDKDALTEFIKLRTI